MHESFPSGEFENQKSVGVVHTLKSGRNRELRADRRSSARVPFALADQARDGKIVYSSVCRARDKSMERGGGRGARRVYKYKWWDETRISSINYPIHPDKSQIHWNFEAERLKREEREINKKI